MKTMIETNEWNHQEEFKAFDEATQKESAKHTTQYSEILEAYDHMLHLHRSNYNKLETE